ncbi:hypothetical protein ACET3Z_026349 [Daucus carota]
MADAIVGDLAAGLIRKLVSLATNQVIQVWKLHEDLETLRQRYELIGALLHDAQTKNIIMSSAKIWFNKLEDVAQVAEAFMDELEFEVTRRKVENRHKVRDFFVPSKNTLLYRSKVAHKIKNINASFDKICKWATDIGLKPVEHLRSTVQHREIRYTQPFEDESLIVGRDDDISFLVNLLCNPNDEGLQVKAILGMGGQGKTTLARMVYNRDAVIKMFPKRMWVTVSDDFDFMMILNQMVVSLTSSPSVLDNAEEVSSNYSTTVNQSHDVNKGSKAAYVRLEGFKDVKPSMFKLRFDTVQALYAEATIFNCVLPKLKYLRVLVLNSFCNEVPGLIGNLKCLKHLDISRTAYSNTSYKLPNHVTRLYNLQTLRISLAHELPENICQLVNLRHLVIGAYTKTRYMFVGIERLTSLQTLPHFVVNKNQNCLVGQLGMLKNLRGSLKLYGLNEVENIEDARKAKLCEKSNVRHLLLKWRNNEDEREEGEYNDEAVLEGLEPHLNLKVLEIEDFMGKKFASWISMMTNMVRIAVTDCSRCEGFPRLGHLPKLREICIKKMENVKVIGNDLCVGLSPAQKAVTSAMYPSVTTLTLRRLPKLEEWVEDVLSKGGKDQIVFPKLEELEISDCPKLRKILNSCFPSLKDLSITNSERILENLVDCKGLQQLTLGVSLKILSVYDCPNLVSINLVEGSAGLKSLYLSGLPSSLLDGISTQIQSSTLRELSLGPFSDEFPWPFSSSLHSFPNLVWLALRGTEMVKSIALFEQLQLSTFPALTELFICDFGGMKDLVLSIAKLPSLADLSIHNYIEKRVDQNGSRFNIFRISDGMMSRGTLTGFLFTHDSKILHECGPFSPAPMNYEECSPQTLEPSV